MHALGAAERQTYTTQPSNQPNTEIIRRMTGGAAEVPQQHRQRRWRLNTRNMMFVQSMRCVHEHVSMHALRRIVSEIASTCTHEPNTSAHMLRACVLMLLLLLLLLVVCQPSRLCVCRLTLHVTRGPHARTKHTETE